MKKNATILDMTCFCVHLLKKNLLRSVLLERCKRKLHIKITILEVEAFYNYVFFFCLYVIKQVYHYKLKYLLTALPNNFLLQRI